MAGDGRCTVAAGPFGGVRSAAGAPRTYLAAGPDRNAENLRRPVTQRAEHSCGLGEGWGGMEGRDSALCRTSTYYTACSEWRILFTGSFSCNREDEVLKSTASILI